MKKHDQLAIARDIESPHHEVNRPRAFAITRWRIEKSMFEWVVSIS